MGDQRNFNIVGMWSLRKNVSSVNLIKKHQDDCVEYFCRCQPTPQFFLGPRNATK
jgi:hypothetical protein